MNNTNQQLNHTEEDEIDLRELWAILMKRKKFIFLFTTIVTIGAIIFALSKTPIYEVTSNVQVGHIGKDLIAPPEVLAKNIEVYFEAMDLKENDSNKNIEVGIVSSISQPKKLKDFITIKTEATSNELALQRNKDVVSYMQSLYSSKMNQIKINAKNNIDNIKRNISNIDNFKKKNILRQIEVIKAQKIVKIDEQIMRLKTQDIVTLEKQINRLKIQDIIKINDKIEFIKTNKLNQINAKINFNQDNLVKYNKSVNDIYKQTKETKDTTLLTVSALQMTNYQNLILSAQNKIEDLKLEKEKLLSETIKNLEIQKKNLIDISIKELQLKIDNIKNITIANLNRDKQNINNDTIRKLQYKLDIDLPAQKVKLQEQIQKAQFSISEQNLKNSTVVGDYIVTDYPIKPKKKLIVVVAFVTGFILSIFIAFFLNFIGKKD